MASVQLHHNSVLTAAVCVCVLRQQSRHNITSDVYTYMPGTLDHLCCGCQERLHVPGTQQT
jgi:hypothetical protein